MSSSDIAISAATISLNIEIATASAAAKNIANASTPGARKTAANFDSLLSSLRTELGKNTPSKEKLDELSNLPIHFTEKNADFINEGISLDDEVGVITLAELRYRTISEAISREFSLLNTASGGKQ